MTAPDGKPRIRVVRRRSVLGEVYAAGWTCKVAGILTTGHGYTPRAAYADWVRKSLPMAVVRPFPLIDPRMT